MTIQGNPNQPDLALEYDAPRDTYVMHVHADGMHHQAVLPPSVVEPLAARARDLRYGRAVPVDDTTGRMIDLAREHAAQEPQEPNGNMPQHLQEEVARVHYHWACQGEAWRLLIGVRLTSRALEP